MYTSKKQFIECLNNICIKEHIPFMHLHLWFKEYLRNLYKPSPSYPIIPVNLTHQFTDDFMLFVYYTGLKFVNKKHVIAYGQYILSQDEYQSLIDVIMVYNRSKLELFTTHIMDIVNYTRAQYVLHIIKQYHRHANTQSTHVSQTHAQALAYAKMYHYMYTDPAVWIDKFLPNEIECFVAFLKSFKTDVHIQQSILNLISNNKTVYDDIINIYTSLKLYDMRVPLRSDLECKDFYTLLKTKGYTCYDIWRYQSKYDSFAIRYFLISKSNSQPISALCLKDLTDETILQKFGNLCATRK